MQHDEFINEVKMNVMRNHALRLSDNDALNVTEEVLQGLAEQLPEASRERMASFFPPEMQDFWSNAGTAKSLTVESFFQSLAEQMSVDVTVAVYYARAVFETMSNMLSNEDLAELRTALPSRFGALFERGAGGDLEMTL